MKTCYIIGAGDCEKISIDRRPEDVVIAADGGMRYCKVYNIIPDIIVGDFDSLDYVPEGDNVIKLPVEKDDTDTSFAVKYGFENGFKRFVIFGALGGSRLDHTFANTALLAFISKRGGEGFLIGNGIVLTSLTDGTICFNEKCNGDISVFSFSDKSEGVSENGLKYSLDNVVLTNENALGVSNSFTGKKGSIAVKNGTLIIYFCGEIGDISDIILDKQ